MQISFSRIITTLILLNALSLLYAVEKNTLGPHQTALKYHSLLKEDKFADAVELMNPEQNNGKLSPQDYKNRLVEMVRRSPKGTTQKSALALKPQFTIVRNNSAAYVCTIEEETVVIYLWNDSEFGWGVLQDANYYPESEAAASEQFAPNIPDMKAIKEVIEKTKVK